MSMTEIDRDVLAFVKQDARAKGLGLREYCRRFGITYTSLRGSDEDLDAAAREVSYDALDVVDDGQDRLERHMLGDFDDSAFLDHLAALRRGRKKRTAA